MNKAKVTVVISPRDRFSGADECIRELYKHTAIDLFELRVLDLGYPQSELKKIQDLVDTRENAHLIAYGPMIPMEAMSRIRADITTDYTVFLDNDSRVTDNWLPPLIDTADRTDCAIVYPVTLERSGVDEGDDIRNHLFTTFLHAVDVDDETYLIEHKTHRRASLESLPTTPTPSEAFEFHCVMFKTEDLKEIEIPMMTIREHLDIGLQLQKQNREILVEPRSQIIFDNLGTRAHLEDLRFFDLRWNSDITYRSSRLFERRWGYKFYSEHSIYNWARRRRLFMLLRWLHLPIPVANFIDRIFSAVRRRISPVWDPLKNPEGNSTPLRDRYSGGTPPQLDHAIS